MRLFSQFAIVGGDSRRESALGSTGDESQSAGILRQARNHYPASRELSKRCEQKCGFLNKSSLTVQNVLFGFAELKDTG
jgi:hypothetical protein